LRSFQSVNEPRNLRPALIFFRQLAQNRPDSRQGDDPVLARGIADRVLGSHQTGITRASAQIVSNCALRQPSKGRRMGKETPARTVLGRTPANPESPLARLSRISTVSA
jgi:hypothetical protein